MLKKNTLENTPRKIHQGKIHFGKIYLGKYTLEKSKSELKGGYASDWWELLDMLTYLMNITRIANVVQCHS